MQVGVVTELVEPEEQQVELDGCKWGFVRHLVKDMAELYWPTIRLRIQATGLSHGQIVNASGRTWWWSRRWLWWWLAICAFSC